MGKVHSVESKGTWVWGSMSLPLVIRNMNGEAIRRMVLNFKHMETLTFMTLFRPLED